LEIRPASIAQIATGRDGRMDPISDDVQGVANALHAIDPHIRLRFSEAGNYFVVYGISDPNLADEDDGDCETWLITTAQELDHRIVKRVEKVYHDALKQGFSLAKQLDDIDAKAERENEHAWTERNGEMYERMAHALRKDLGYDQGRIYVPEKV